MSLLGRAAQNLAYSKQLVPVLRTGLAYPVMELQLNQVEGGSVRSRDSDARRVTSRQEGVMRAKKAAIMWCRSVRLL